MQLVAVFDFISHEFMHHPFNEGYLRMLRYAFPDAELVFNAQESHIRRLSPNLADVSGLTFRPCLPLNPPLGLSVHNPIGGHLAARACLAQMVNAIGDRPLVLAAVLGVDANLLLAFRRLWPKRSAAPLHMILHNHLGDSFRWRTRNPLFRRFDFRSVMQKPLPRQQRLIVLELGIREATIEVAPALAPSIETLEHPVLTSEWIGARNPDQGERLKIGFLGQARNAKGFDRFVEIARACGPDKEFHSIGLTHPEIQALDLSVLTRQPSPASLPRADYVAGLKAIDAVCLPLSSAYDFVASGSVTDAIAALKPVFCVRNRSLAAIFAKYGPIGYLAQDIDDLTAYVRQASQESIFAHMPEWVANLTRIRAARTPQALAPAYARGVNAPSIRLT